MHKGFEDGERARSVRKKEGTYVYFLLSPPNPVAFAVNESPRFLFSYARWTISKEKIKIEELWTD